MTYFRGLSKLASGCKYGQQMFANEMSRLINSLIVDVMLCNNKNNNSGNTISILIPVVGEMFYRKSIGILNHLDFYRNW